jgi:hypothetical protein
MLEESLQQQKKEEEHIKFLTKQTLDTLTTILWSYVTINLWNIDSSQ